MQLMNIGDAAAAAGVTPKMIRHYESLGLIPVAERTDAGYRLYGDREIDMLRFIRQSRGLGFSMQQIGELMCLWRDPSRRSSHVKQVALKQLDDLQARQRELDQMRATLEDLVTQCRGDHMAHCAILDNLAHADAAPVPVELAKAARKGLKVTRPGESRPRRRALAAPAVQAMPGGPHAGLVAWSRGISNSSSSPAAR